MAQAKKFGALSGVFTPSILTILGVIMYLRLPAIVGQGGLVQTLLIIAVAHVISITTGLSVSSIATDKKVRAGGTYYMISRSLGLPIGGTLGLALFVGLSFSVSLYLIGFSESFLGFWGLPTDLTAIRIAGSVTLVVVTGVTLISTALALKAQFYIMAAIALSLLSIVLGSHDFAPAAADAAPVATAVPFIVLFGIFFPAVTGFEAGVSMSGDLADPKSAIPKGTISAILVGLLAYIGLATFLATTVSADQLAGNPRILLDIALFPPLVVAGIWGATISSAFGSILGAPRILQATSVDGITPRWFGRGYGRENEPRHALVLAFVIAEAGILIGELDAIARIVSMFFITTYGVLNFTAAIETRVSPDFRPEFRVPALIPLVGAGACFIVMIQLDFVAMVGASVVLAGLYLYLKRKQLRLETGDTWQGVWSTMARAALARLDRADTQLRNWRPNILLFGDDAPSSAHRVEFARQLTSQRGVLTRVQVVTSVDADPGPRVAPASPANAPLPAADPPGGDGAEPADGEVFTRRFHGADAYETIARVARYYGFSGIEPNTVLLGWARSADSPRFTKLLQGLVEEDLNVLLLDFDRDRGYGRHERIDVWWRLTGKDVAFSLALVRFLTTSDRWRDARVRFLTVNDGPPALTLPIGRDLARVLEEHRLEADVRVINNAADGRSFVDIVRVESLEADLTVLGMADVRGEEPGRFIADTNALVNVLGTALLVHASSFFREPLIESAALTALQSDAGAGDEGGRLEAGRLPPLARPAGEPIPALLSGLDGALQERVESLFEDYLGRAYELNRSALDDIGTFAVATLETAAGAVPGDPARAPADRADPRFLDAALEHVAALRETGVAQGALLAGAAERLPAAAAALAETVPERVRVTPPREAWRRAPGEPLAVSLARLRARASSAVARRTPSYRTPLREVVRARLTAFADRALDDAFAAFAADASRAAEAAGRLLANALEQVDRVGREPAAGEGEPRASVTPEALREEAAAAADVSRTAARRARLDTAVAAREAINAVAGDAARLDAARALREARRAGSSDRASTETPDRAAEWEEVQHLTIAEVELALRLRGLADVVSRTGRTTRARVADLLEGELIAELERLRAGLGDATERPAEWSASGVEALAFLDTAFHPEALVERIRVGLAEDLATVPASVSVPAAESAGDIAAGRFEGVVAATFPARQVVEYVIESDLLGPLLEELSAAAPRIADATELGREVAQLTAFHLGSHDAAGGSTSSRDQVATLMKAGVQRTDRAIAAVREAREQLDAGIERRFTALAGRLDGTTIHRLAERLPQYLRSQRGRQVLGGARRVGRRAAAWTREQAVRLVYRRSEGIVLARQLSRDAAGDPESLEPVRRFVEAVSPRPAVLDALPDYYRQLFLGHPAVTEQIRVGFNRELAEADAAVAARRGGAGGALVILGEPGQGRRFLSGLIAQRHAGPAGVFRVDAPDGGSVDPAAFTARVGRALGRPGAASPATLAAALPHGSALVVNDLESWWERSPDGDAVLDALDTLIARVPMGCLVILNAAPRSFRLMNRMRPLDDRILRLIECEPFNALQLRQVILPRHASTGLTFEWNGRGEDQLAELRLARLFDAHFDFCDGNVGIALQAWIANIDRVDGERLYIRAPDEPPIDAFETLGHVQLMLIVQLLLHGRLTRRRLARLSRLDPATLARGLRGLVRAGLVREGPGGVLAVDRFVRHHLSRFLIERGTL